MRAATDREARCCSAEVSATEESGLSSPTFARELGTIDCSTVMEHGSPGGGRGSTRALCARQERSRLLHGSHLLTLCCGSTHEHGARSRTPLAARRGPMACRRRVSCCRARGLRGTPTNLARGRHPLCKRLAQICHECDASLVLPLPRDFTRRAARCLVQDERFRRGDGERQTLKSVVRDKGRLVR
jgi:hypothetical protein